MSISRAAGIPTRINYGSFFKGPLDAQDQDQSYHCWLEYYAPNVGWIPLDVAIADIFVEGVTLTEENKPKITLTTADGYGGPDAKMVDYYFGNIDERRVVWSHGRDLHRALLGSIERFFGILIEHYGGDFPLWLAPVQSVVIPVSQNYFEYARSVNETLIQSGIRTQLDERNEKIGYKIRDWETQKVPYMIIVGEKEQSASNISVRQHKKGDLGAFNLSDFIDKLVNEIKNKDYTTN